MGMLRDADEPADPSGWARELEQIDAAAAARQLGPRPLLVVHGNDDVEVPLEEARALADAARASELRIVNGGGHRLRHDPRAIATLLGWLARQGTEAPIPRHPLI
jgi:putative redox protein